jgi:hypothetical protein
MQVSESQQQTTRLSTAFPNRKGTSMFLMLAISSYPKTASASVLGISEKDRKSEIDKIKQEQITIKQ